MREDTLPLSHFEAIYERGEDPWSFASSAYERDKYAATLAALPRARYARALEVGCSIGVFTAMLAPRCDDLLAAEPVTSALEGARLRNAGQAHVRFSPLFMPRDWPDERFDLVVLSEVLDYLGEQDLAGVAAALRRTLQPGGDIVLVHWVGKKRHATAAASETSELLIAALADLASIVHQQRNPAYRLDVLSRFEQPPPCPSSAPGPI